MSPQNFDELLSAYIDGELSAQERAAVEEQLTQDAAARRLYQQLMYLRKELRGLPKQKPAANFSTQLQTRLSQTRMQPGAKAARSSATLWQLIAGFSALAAALVLGWAFWSRGTGTLVKPPVVPEMATSPVKSPNATEKKTTTSLVEARKNDKPSATQATSPAVDLTLAALVECDVTSAVIQRHALEQALTRHSIPLQGESLTGKKSTGLLLVEAPLEQLHLVLSDINQDETFLSLQVFPAPMQTAQRQLLRYRREPASADALIASSHGKEHADGSAQVDLTVPMPIDHAFVRALTDPAEVEQSLKIVRTDADTGLSPAEIAATLPHARQNQPTPIAPASPTSVGKELPKHDPSPMPDGFVRVLFRLHVIDAP
jgi:predicted anti-sigma-YlaC factor YlaD